MIVQEAIERLINNRTTIVIAHRLSTIENADKILVLDNGSLSESGTHDELLDQDGIYKSLYQNKFNDSEDPKKPSRKSVGKEYLPTFTEEPTQQGYLIDAWYSKSFWLYILAPFTFYFLHWLRLEEILLSKIQKKFGSLPNL